MRLRCAGSANTVRAGAPKSKPGKNAVRSAGVSTSTSQYSSDSFEIATCWEDTNERMSGEAGRRADAFLARAGLADRAGSLVSTLSGGMQRRVNIGAALMHRPELLVLDEPTVGVDLHARERIHDLLAGAAADLKKEEKTFGRAYEH